MEDWAKRLNAKMAGFTEPVAGAAPVISGAGKVAAGLWWALGAVAAAAAVAGIVANAPEAYDTLKEIADWIATDVSGAAAMNSQITSNTGAIGVLNGDAST